MINILKILPVIAVLLFFKYEQIRLTKRQIRAYLEAMHAEDIVIKLERFAYRCDVYHVTCEIDGERIRRYVDYSLFNGMKWRAA